VDDDPSPVRQHCVDGGGHRGRRVDHDQVAGRDVIGEIAEPGVDRLVLAAGDHQPNTVTGEPPGLGRRRRDVGVVELEVERQAGRQIGVSGGLDLPDRSPVVDRFDRRRGHGATPLAAISLAT
jgi:hypothetical protein